MSPSPRSNKSMKHGARYNINIHQIVLRLFDLSLKGTRSSYSCVHMTGLLKL
jgi:hypothetical protein